MALIRLTPKSTDTLVRTEDQISKQMSNLERFSDLIQKLYQDFSKISEDGLQVTFETRAMHCTRALRLELGRGQPNTYIPFTFHTHISKNYDAI